VAGDFNEGLEDGGIHGSGLHQPAVLGMHQ